MSVGNIRVPGGVREATISAVIIRKDGTRENLGVVSHYHKSLWKRFSFRLGQWFKRAAAR